MTAMDGFDTSGSRVTLAKVGEPHLLMESGETQIAFVLL